MYNAEKEKRPMLADAIRDLHGYVLHETLHNYPPKTVVAFLEELYEKMSDMETQLTIGADLDNPGDMPYEIAEKFDIRLPGALTLGCFASGFGMNYACFAMHAASKELDALPPCRALEVMSQIKSVIDSVSDDKMASVPPDAWDPIFEDAGFRCRLIWDEGLPDTELSTRAFEAGVLVNDEQLHARYLAKAGESN